MFRMNIENTLKLGETIALHVFHVSEARRRTYRSITIGRLSFFYSASFKFTVGWRTLARLRLLASFKLHVIIKIKNSGKRFSLGQMRQILINQVSVILGNRDFPCLSNITKCVWPKCGISKHRRFMKNPNFKFNVI